jgi:N-acetylglucosaminyldiphosphoundecaprenol N-acetyl-beta-D-mannosaminyltransferase
MHKAANILGFQLFSKRKVDLLKKIQIHLSSKNECLIIFTPNAEQLVQTEQNPKFNRYLQQADILIPDGISLVWSSRLLSLRGKSRPIAERIAGVDLTQELLQLAKKQDLHCLVIGGEGYHHLQPDSQQVGDNLWQLQPHLFWTPGYQNIQRPNKKEEQVLKSNLKKLKPHIVFAAFGAPWQEEWIIEHRDFLNNQDVRLAMSVGGAFDLILGKLKRAPGWMRKLGLEWLYRLIQEPWRWKRQLRLAKFVKMVLNQA